MNLRTVSLAVTALTVLSPTLSFARTDSAAMQACAAAFAASIAPVGSAPAFKLSVQDHYFSNRENAYLAADYSFDMKAVDQKTGVASARATCMATEKGSVLSLSTTSLSKNTPALASAF